MRTMDKNKTNSRTFEGQNIVRQSIEKYLTERGMTSVRKIAAFVARDTGMNISPSTVARLVRNFGYDREEVTWQKVEQGMEWVKK